jgi:hypothetical protein
MGRYRLAWAVLIIAAGLVLRLWGLGFGLPYQFHQDEPIIVNHALAYGTGDLNPHFFIIPPLTSYILFFLYAAYFLLLKILCVVKGFEDFAISFFRDPTPFYLIGRFALGLLPGTINIALTYKLARRFFSRTAALYSAILMSVAFLNVINSHYIYTDNLMVCLVLFAYLAMSAIIENPKGKYYIIAGVFTGMAIASKYNAAVLLGSFLTAELIKRDRAGGTALNIKILLFGVITIISFVVCNPFSVIDFKFFMSSITGKIMHGYLGLSHHICYSLFEGLGSLVTISGMAGLAIYLRTNFKKAVFLISFPSLFYLHLIFASQPYSRYVLVLAPFISMGAGFLLFDYLPSRFKYKSQASIIFVLSILFILPTAIKSVKADMLLAGKDTRTEATEWIQNNIPYGSKIALDHTFFGPQLKQSVKQLREKKSIIDIQPELKALKTRKLDLQIKAVEGEKTYEVYYITAEGEKAGQFLNFWPVIMDNMEDLKKHEIHYVVLSNMSFSENMKKIHKELAKKARPLAVFSPYADKKFRLSRDPIELTNIPVKSDELFSRCKPGPYLVIYELK